MVRARGSFAAMAAIGLIALAGCGGGGASSSSAADATTYFDQSVSSHYGNGQVAKGDGRGCVKVSTGHFSCTAYVRSHAGSLDSGLDVIGTVTVSDQKMTAQARPATGAEITAWFQGTPGGRGAG
jgi:hypothetical protein